MKITEGKQYTDAWYAIRRGVPTASEFSSIITPKKAELSKSIDPYICSLIADKHDPEYPRVDDYASAAMKNGTALEASARAWYELQTDLTVRQVCFCLHDGGKFGCSPDGLVDPDGVLELKSPLPKTHVTWLLAGVLPDEHKVQVHGHLIVTGRKWCDFCSYVPGFPGLRVRVEPDEFTAKLADALAEFSERYSEIETRLNLPADLPEPVQHDPPDGSDDAPFTAGPGRAGAMTLTGERRRETSIEVDRGTTTATPPLFEPPMASDEISEAEMDEIAAKLGGKRQGD